MADNPPYLSFNTQLRYGNWTGPGYSAGRTSPPFEAYTQADFNYPGYDDFDTSLSKPHDIAYEQAQVTFDSQWDAATASQRVTLLVNYFQTIENADLNFIAGIPFHSAVNDWGNTLRFLAIPGFSATASVDAETIHLLTTDTNYAASLTGLSRQTVENRIDTAVDTALNAALYWFAQLGEIAAAVAAATTSLKDLVDALNHGDDYADQAAALIGSGGSSSGLLNTVLQQLQGRSGAIYDIARASSSTGGTEGNGNSLHPSISGDGRYVAFYSYASNLVTGDTNGASDIFVYDRQANTISRVSVGSGGAEANHGSFDPSITSDGRYVAFESGATNLVPGDLAGWDEIFVYDRSTGATVRASMGLPAQGQSEPNFPSMHPSISLDASGSNYAVAYASDASNLVAGDSNNGVSDIFLYQGSTHAITRITDGNGTSDNPSISTTGAVAFESYASNLVSGDTNNFEDIFLFTGSGMVRVAPNGVQPNGNSAHASISADGKFIAFQSLASNLVAGDTNTDWDIFVYDVVNHTIERISIATDGTQSNNDSFAPTISADGRFVTYESWASNLVPGQSQTSHAEQTFAYDRQLHITKLVSVSAAGEQGDQNSVDPVISADGSTVAFDSGATNLYRQDGALDDVFVTDSSNFFTKGGPQNDTIASSTGNDVLDGGGGINTVSYASIAAAVTVSLATVGAQNTGGGGTDTLTNFSNIIGGSGADHLTGDATANSLSGGGGDDVLNGGAGADILTGGAGNDKFVFDAAALSDATAATPVFDEVTDYTTGDQVDLSAILSAAYNHGSGQAVGALVRAVEDASGTFARLQVDPDGTANGVNWITVARLDGVPGGANVNVILDSSLSSGSTVSAGANHAPVMSVTSASVAATAGQTLSTSGLFSATDADNDALSYFLFDATSAANSGHFSVNGATVPAGSPYGVTASQLAQTSFVAGASGTSDDLFVEAFDGTAYSGWSEFHVNVAAAANHAPVMSVTSANVAATAGQTLSTSGLFSATDADNDTLSYFLFDATAGANSGHFSVNGATVPAGAPYGVTAAQLAQTSFVAGASGASDDLFVEAYDGKAYSGWSEFHVNVAAAANHAPVISVTSANVAATAGQSLSASSLFGATDADNDTLSYFLFDATPGASSGHFSVNGSVVPDGAPYGVSAAQLAQTSFVAGSSGASDDLFVEAYDGKVYSGWSEFHVNVAAAANHAPVMSVTSANVAATAGQSLSASSLFGATDADNDTLSYFLFDATPGASSGHFSVNGSVVPDGSPYGVSAAQLAQTSFVAGSSGASDDLFVEAYDGKAYSGWSEFHVNVAAAANHAPVMSVTSANVAATAGQSLTASSLFVATDADHDTLSYFVFDNSADPNSGHFSVNGTAVAAGATYAISAAQLAQTTFIAGTSGSSDDLFVEAFDGKAYSGWSEFHVNVAATANHAPVMSVPSANVAATAGQSLSASSLFSATDADHDTLSYFVFDATPAANSGHFSVNGTVVPAGAAYGVTAAQLAQTSFVTGASGTSDDLFVEAYDGKVYSGWSEFHVLT